MKNKELWMLVGVIEWDENREKKTKEKIMRKN